MVSHPSSRGGAHTAAGEPPQLPPPQRSARFGAARSRPRARRPFRFELLVVACVAAVALLRVMWHRNGPEGAGSAALGGRPERERMGVLACSTSPATARAEVALPSAREVRAMTVTEGADSAGAPAVAACGATAFSSGAESEQRFGVAFLAGECTPPFGAESVESVVFCLVDEVGSRRRDTLEVGGGPKAAADGLPNAFRTAADSCRVERLAAPDLGRGGGLTASNLRVFELPSGENAFAVAVCGGLTAAATLIVGAVDGSTPALSTPAAVKLPGLTCRDAWAPVSDRAGRIIIVSSLEPFRACEIDFQERLCRPRASPTNGAVSPTPRVPVAMLGADMDSALVRETIVTDEGEVAVHRFLLGSSGEKLSGAFRFEQTSAADPAWDLEAANGIITLGDNRVAVSYSSLSPGGAETARATRIAILQLEALPLAEKSSGRGAGGCGGRPLQVEHFQMMERTSGSCAIEARAPTHTVSEFHAMRWCAASRACTHFLRDARSGLTSFCLGFIRARKPSWGAGVAVAARGGCEHVDGTLAETYKRTGARVSCHESALQAFSWEYGRRAHCNAPVSVPAPTLHAVAMRCLAEPSCDRVALELGAGLAYLCTDDMQATAGGGGGGGTSSRSRPSLGWVSGWRLNKAEAKLRAGMVVVDEARANCGEFSLRNSFHTESLVEAQLACAGEPHCTALTRNAKDGETFLCQGQYPHSGERAYGWAMSYFKDCKAYTEGAVRSDMLAGKLPKCRSPAGSHERGCPGGLYPLSKHDTAGTLTCAECAAAGFCPVLSPDAEDVIDSQLFNAKLQGLAYSSRSSGSLPGFDAKYIRVFNPSLFYLTSTERIFASFRVSDSARCNYFSAKEEWLLDASKVNKERYNSTFGICELDQRSMLPLPRACTVLGALPQAAIIAKLVKHARKLFPASDINSCEYYSGFEDARGFSFGDRAYIIASIGFKTFVTLGDTRLNVRVSRLALLELSLDTKDLVSNAVLLTLGEELRSNKIQTADQKNWMPIADESRKELLMVHRVQPWSVCRVDLRSGECIELPFETPLSIRTAGADSLPPHHVVAGDRVWPQESSPHGSTPFVSTPWGYLSLIHTVLPLEMGRVYNHKAILVDFDTREITHISEPFRLPCRGDADEACTGEDIQFAAGILVREKRGGGDGDGDGQAMGRSSKLHTLVVSYGVWDCHSHLVEVPLPPPPPANSDEPWRLTRTNTDSISRTLGAAAPVVRWEGSVTGTEGFATVAREMARILVTRKEVTLQLKDMTHAPAPEVTLSGPRFAAVKESLIQSNSDMRQDPAVTIRMGWPPNFAPVLKGKLVMYLPWEFGPLPEAFTSELLSENVAEVWVPLPSVKAGMVAGGVPASKVHVVTHGADPISACTLPSSPSPLEMASLVVSRKKFKLLYHGGMLWRKGADLMLAAYEEAFTSRDDVVLIVHSSYGDEEVQTLLKGYVRAQTEYNEECNGAGTSGGSDWFARLRSQKHDCRKPGPPEIEVITRVLTSGELAALYAASDVLVHPSRSEGYGLSMVEAMACGLPPIVLGSANALDLVSEESAFVIPAREQTCARKPCWSDGAHIFRREWTAPRGSTFTWVTAELGAFASLLRGVYEQPELVVRKAESARRHARAKLTWDIAAEQALCRLHMLGAGRNVSVCTRGMAAVSASIAHE
mmetsp:Transcript_5998/g.20264  ORF Transcript_5998/g.20264 Transcript_5998/m.20264 type:complete len:1661 (-) Transcript_5998:101-5083(-)